MRDGAPGADRVGRGERWGIPLADPEADVRPVEDLTMRPAISVSLNLIATVLQACGPDTPTGVRPLEGDVPLAGTLEFNGGTGRFAEADGSATLNLTIDLDERTGELEFRGAMSP